MSSYFDLLPEFLRKENGALQKIFLALEDLLHEPLQSFAANKDIKNLANLTGNLLTLFAQNFGLLRGNFTDTELRAILFAKLSGAFEGNDTQKILNILEFFFPGRNKKIRLLTHPDFAAQLLNIKIYRAFDVWIENLTAQEKTVVRSLCKALKPAGVLATINLEEQVVSFWQTPNVLSYQIPNRPAKFFRNLVNFESAEVNMPKSLYVASAEPYADTTAYYNRYTLPVGMNGVTYDPQINFAIGINNRNLYRIDMSTGNVQTIVNSLPNKPAANLYIPLYASGGQNILVAETTSGLVLVRFYFSVNSGTSWSQIAATSTTAISPINYARNFNGYEFIFMFQDGANARCIRTIDGTSYFLQTLTSSIVQEVNLASIIYHNGHFLLTARLSNTQPPPHLAVLDSLSNSNVWVVKRQERPILSNITHYYFSPVRGNRIFLIYITLNVFYYSDTFFSENTPQITPKFFDFNGNLISVPMSNNAAVINFENITEPEKNVVYYSANRYVSFSSFTMDYYSNDSTQKTVHYMSFDNGETFYPCRTTYTRLTPISDIISGTQINKYYSFYVMDNSCFIQPIGSTVYSRLIFSRKPTHVDVAEMSYVSDATPVTVDFTRCRMSSTESLRVSGAFIWSSIVNENSVKNMLSANTLLRLELSGALDKVAEVIVPYKTRLISLDTQLLFLPPLYSGMDVSIPGNYVDIIAYTNSIIIFDKFSRDFHVIKFVARYSEIDNMLLPQTSSSPPLNVGRERFLFGNFNFFGYVSMYGRDLYFFTGYLSRGPGTSGNRQHYIFCIDLETKTVYCVARLTTVISSSAFYMPHIITGAIKNKILLLLAGNASVNNLYTTSLQLSVSKSDNDLSFSLMPIVINKLIDAIGQDGIFLSSRVINDFLYILYWHSVSGVTHFQVSKYAEDGSRVGVAFYGSVNFMPNIYNALITENAVYILIGNAPATLYLLMITSAGQNLISLPAELASAESFTIEETDQQVRIYAIQMISGVRKVVSYGISLTGEMT